MVPPVFVLLCLVAARSPFRPGLRLNKSVVVPLRRPTADTGKLVHAAVLGMRRMYEPGYKMAKTGVLLLDLVLGRESYRRRGYARGQGRTHETPNHRHPESLHSEIKSQCAMRGSKIADEVRDLLLQKYRKQ